MIPVASQKSPESADVDAQRRESADQRQSTRRPVGTFRRIFRFVWLHPFVSAEVAIAVLVLWWLLTDPVFRAALGLNIWLLGVNLLSSVRATVGLLQVDTLGTFLSLASIAGRLLIATLPILALARHWRGWQRLHLALLPLIYALWPLVGTPSAPLLVAVSALSLWLIRFRGLRWTAILPVALMCASVPIHQFGTVWNHTALLQRCANNDGRRPVNLKPEQINPDYVGVSQLRPDEILLPASGGRGSWWLRRTDSGWMFEAPSKVNYAFWGGCLLDGELWLARPNFMMGVRRDAATGEESIRKVELPVKAMDFADVVCLPEDDRVLVTEALSGSAIWEVTTATEAVRRWPQDVGGIGSMARRGLGDQLLAGAGSDLVVYSLAREEVVERVPAGVQMFGGIDVCPSDGEVALGDVAGRVRFFNLDVQGHYRFDWGIALRGPRVVAYSPDCQYVAVTSWDDESVYLVDRKSRRRVETYRVGPALRDVTFLGPRELAVVDACTMSVMTF